MLHLILWTMGLYVITRCSSLFTRKGEREESRETRVMAVITALLTFMFMLGSCTMKGPS